MPTPRELLARLADTPHLARAIPHLSAEVLHGVIQHCGLEQCADLLMLATSEQLSAVLDLDLWHPQSPGRDEHFDAARFCEWLDVLADADIVAAAQRVAELDPMLTVAGFAPQISVFDPGVFEPVVERTGADVVVNLPDARLRADIGGYIVAAKRPEWWDTIVAVLMTLEAHHRERFDHVMRGCRRLSNSKAEVDGLDDLLDGGEQAQFDLAIGRERRRDTRGYVTPAQARAFLQSSRTISLATAGPPAPDPIFAAFMRTSDASIEPDLPADDVDVSAAPADDASSADVGAVVDLLRDAGVLRDHAQRLLPGANDALPVTSMDRCLQFVCEHDDVAYAARLQELAFLGNVLVSGCSVHDRPFTQLEASRAVPAICNLGLENWPRRWLSSSAAEDETRVGDDVLLRHDAVTVFRVGWSVLYRDVTMFTAEALVSVLDEIRCSDRDVAMGLYVLRRELTKQCQAGAPWQARQALDVLATLDLPGWAALLGLIAECPVMLANVARYPAPVLAISVSEFEFISTNAHIESIRSFVHDLPRQLTA